jgi:cation/acetate symporter
MAYVLFGGMLATTWVQIVKAVLLLGARSLLALLVLRVRFNPLALFAAAADAARRRACSPRGKLVSNPLDAISLGSR